MRDKPKVWHYGLIAETWAAFGTETPELSYYEKRIEHFGQPVLDLACGTGRLLIPLLRAGFEVDGADISADMLAFCRKKAYDEGLVPRLYNQAMHEFQLPQNYKTIYICGSFGLAGSRSLDFKTLEKCYQHLDKGGALIFNVDVDYHYPDAWQDWLNENRQKLPQPWPEEGRRRVDQEGNEYITRSRILYVDPLEQSYSREMRIEKFRDGKLVAQEERTLKGNMYFKNELLWMLTLAGFKDIEVQGDYTEEEATADHKELIFIARK